MNNSENLINELSFPLRSKILQELLDEPLKLNDIANKFTVSKSEISRHLSRLTEINIVTKNNKTHDYILTPLGEAYITLLLPVKFVLDKNDFFQNHFIDLPTNLSRMIDNLGQSKCLIGSGEVLNTIQNVLENTEECVQILLDQKFPLNLKKKIKLGKYIITPDIAEKGAEYAKKIYEQVEVRTLNPINHNMLISDHSIGMINFPGLNHKADISYSYYITDETGLNYLQDIWDFYWKLGSPISL